MASSELILAKGLLDDIKRRLRASQIRAALSANEEMIRLYWDIGCLIASKQQAEGWGSGVIPRLAVELKNEIPEQKGFSVSNLERMVRFYREYSDCLPFPAQPVRELGTGENEANEQRSVNPAQAVPELPRTSSADSTPLLSLSWGHQIVLMQKLKDRPTRFWYAGQAVAEGWNRDTLIQQIKSSAHTRQGSAVTNFTNTLPDPQSELAQQLVKDPYIFDFLTISEPFLERELETGLLTHLQKFLVELGRGFAFVGRQHRLEVSDQEFFLDLLFYHLELRCFVVVDLKRGPFKPEYAGKMNFYCSVVDEQLRHAQDQPTIGMILCQTKDRVLAEYSLRDINKPIGVADYELTRALPENLASSLPSIETIEAELSQDLEDQS